MYATLPSRKSCSAPSRFDSESDDQNLAARIQAREESAAEELVRQYSGRMLAVARRILGNEEDSHDAVQEAFISAFRQLDSFQGASRLSTWLHRIVVNACLMRIRTRSRRPQTASIDDLLPQFDSSNRHATPPSRWSGGVLDKVLMQETRAQVRDCIDQLPREYREVILLRDIEELDTQQAAAALGISVSAAKVRLHRARQALRTLLDPHFA